MMIPRSIASLVSLGLNLLVLALIGSWAPEAKGQCTQQFPPYMEYYRNAWGPAMAPYPQNWPVSARTPANWAAQTMARAAASPAPVPAMLPSPQSVPTPSPHPAIQAPVPTVTGWETDPYGFVIWLNGQRAARGLHAVVWDETCLYHAYINNTHQAARGLGHHHHVMRRQNAGMGGSATIWPAWIGSPGHAAALFDPSITRVGLHIQGQWQTYNAN